MPTNPIYPKLSSLVTIDELPDQLSFIQTGLSTILDDLYYRDFLFGKSVSGDEAFYQLIIRAYKRIGIDIPGTGFAMVLNPAHAGPGDLTEIPITVNYELPIIGFVKEFSIQNFSFGNKDFFDLISEVIQGKDDRLILETVNNFITSPTPFNDFVDSVNTEYSLAGPNLIPYPSGASSCVFEIIYNTLDSAQTSICKGDSMLFGGGYVSTAGYYYDTLRNINGCDSVVVLQLSIDSVSLAAFTNDTVCGDDSLVPLPAGSPSGGVYTGTGVSGAFFDPSIAGAGLFTIFYTYTDTVAGCTATDSTVIFVDTVMVNLSAFSPDSVCNNGGLVALPAASSAGGTYSGTGVVGTDFDPLVAGVGLHTVYYSYTDSITMCSGTDSTQIYVKNCIGIDENGLNKVLAVYPNPVQNMIRIYAAAGHGISKVRLMNVAGEELLIRQVHGAGNLHIDMSDMARGSYLLFITMEDGSRISRKVVK